MKSNESQYDTELIGMNPSEFQLTRWIHQSSILLVYTFKHWNTIRKWMGIQIIRWKHQISSKITPIHQQFVFKAYICCSFWTDSPIQTINEILLQSIDENPNSSTKHRLSTPELTYTRLIKDPFYTSKQIQSTKNRREGGKRRRKRYHRWRENRPWKAWKVAPPFPGILPAMAMLLSFQTSPLSLSIFFLSPLVVLRFLKGEKGGRTERREAKGGKDHENANFADSISTFNFQLSTFKPALHSSFSFFLSLNLTK